MWGLSRLHTDKADAQHLVLLRPRRERPSGRAAEQCDEVATAGSVGGTSRPSARAVGRLMTNSNLLDCTTGRSAGLAPLRILPVYMPTWRYVSVWLVP